MEELVISPSTVRHTAYTKALHSLVKYRTTWRLTENISDKDIYTLQLVANNNSNITSTSTCTLRRSSFVNSVGNFFNILIFENINIYHDLDSINDYYYNLTSDSINTLNDGSYYKYSINYNKSDLDPIIRYINNGIVSMNPRKLVFTMTYNKDTFKKDALFYIDQLDKYLHTSEQYGTFTRSEGRYSLGGFVSDYVIDYKENVFMLYFNEDGFGINGKSVNATLIYSKNIDIKYLDVTHADDHLNVALIDLYDRVTPISLSPSASEFIIQLTLSDFPVFNTFLPRLPYSRGSDSIRIEDEKDVPIENTYREIRNIQRRLDNIEYTLNKQ